MSQKNCARNGCRDVFHAALVKDASFAGPLELPCMAGQKKLPNRLISFSRAISCKDHDQWIHFFEDDCKFERLWNDPVRYLPILKRYNGAISPDFSLYRDMPLVMQQWNTYRSRALGHWMQANGIPVIPNIRFGDERTYDFCCSGIEQGGIIAVGSHGCMKLLRERQYFMQGLDHVVKTLKPKTVVVYGSAPDEVFGRYKEAGIEILQFDSACTVSHRKAVS